MNKEKNIVQITRSRYKQIKKMDHNSMERAIEHYYRQGYTDGRNTIKENIQTAITEIGNIKDIGSRRMEEIREIIHKAAGKDETFYLESKYLIFEPDKEDSKSDMQTTDKAMQPIEVLAPDGRTGYECRNCGNDLSVNCLNGIYCHWCGQKLDWEKGE